MGSNDRLPASELFGRYRIVRLLGEGGMGAVYEAVHPILKKRVAIKTLLPALAAQPDARARFLREGEAASRINHPNVVAVHDVGTEGETPYLVMEYLEGETLDALLERRSVLAVAEAVDIMLPVISAVATGHEQGVIHRDLKPQNIFLSRGPWGEAIPKVLDFGVSKLVGAPENAVLTGTQAVLGTVAYMSPEQARGARGVDAKSDQYAVGLMLYEMVTGGRAHPGESALEILHHIASGTIVPPRAMRPDLSAAMEDALVRCLAAQPADRFPSLRALGRALLPLASDKARLGLADGFREPVITEVSAGAAQAARRTMVMPPEGVAAKVGSGPASPATAMAVGAGAANGNGRQSEGSAGGTRILTPPPKLRSDSTFRQAASELATAGDLRKKSRAPLVVVALALVAAGAAAAFVATRRGSDASDSMSNDMPGTAARMAAAPASAVTAPIAPPAAPSMAAATTPSPPLPAAQGHLRRIEIKVAPAQAQLVLDDGSPRIGRLDASLPADQVVHTVRISADGYIGQTITFDADTPPPALVKLARAPARPAAARPGLSAHPARPRRSGPPAATTATTDDGPVTDTPPAAELPSPPRRGANNALILK